MTTTLRQRALLAGVGATQPDQAFGINEVVDFERAYSAWREQPFPLGSRLDALDEVHADLVLVDTWVAATIIPLVEAGRYHPAQVDVLGKLQEIRHRAIELRKAGSTVEKPRKRVRHVR